MYWCKIATTEQEFDDIAKLNYATFVEEIPQHEPNDMQRKVDRFHDENSYLVVYKKSEMIGMLAFRDLRPFSLDEKIGMMEDYLPPQVCEKLCEIRLLAVKKAYRTGRVFLKLTQAVYAFAYEKGYTAAVISGTTREQKLYTQMGFEQFADAIGTDEARYLPMVLTRQKFQDSLEKRIATSSQYTFYPGPVQQNVSLQHTGTSHRSITFANMFGKLRQKLIQLSDANYVAVMVGTGTLANDVMLAQLNALSSSKGLILSNGEFGDRLIRQAGKWALNFEEVRVEWGQPFDVVKLEVLLKTGQYDWLLMVHGETSTATLNQFEPVLQLTKHYHVKLCVDCMSSFGALPFSMKDLHLATSVSGKAIGAMSGLAFVFSQELAEQAQVPTYLELANYQGEGVSFTMPTALVVNVQDALNHYPERYEVLAQRFQLLQTSILVQRFALKTCNYPMIITLQVPDWLIHFSEDLKLNSLYVHAESSYLKKHQYIQLSIIQPNFEQAFKMLEGIYRYYEVVMGEGIMVH